MNQAALMQAVSSVGLFLLLAIPGYLFSRKEWIMKEQVSGLSAVMVNYLWPVMVLDAMAQVNRGAEMLGGMLRVAGYSVVSLAIGAVMAWLWLKVTKRPAIPGMILMFALMFSNTGLIGIPLMNSLFAGDPRLGEAMVYTTVMEMVSNVGIFTVGMMMIQVGCGKEARPSPRSLLSPGMVGVVLGLLLLLSGLELPGIILDFLSKAGGASTAITMFIVGAQMGEMGLRDALTDKTVYEYCLMKLIIIPAAFYFVIWVLLGDTGVPGLATILLTAMPGPTCAALFSRQYGGDYQLATRCVMVSTLLCVATIPVLMSMIW